MKTENNKIKYFIYARKSSENEDRQMASIEDQINELRKLARENSLEVVDVLSESKSAKAPGRVVFNEMLDRIHKGEADGIICWKLNRLARNPIDGGQVSWMLQQNIIKHVQTFGRGYYPTDNVIIMAVELGMANQFIRDLSIDTKRGLRNKAERGWYPAHASLGYMDNPLRKKGEKEIIKDPERFNLVRRMFDLMLTGTQTPPRILKIAIEQWGLRNRSGKRISVSNIYRIFNDPFYYGSFEYPKGSGNWYKGKHEPIISEEEYWRIQGILGDKGKQRPKTHTFAYTGLIRCAECSSTITAENKVKRQKNGNIHYYTYYHCTKKKNPNCSQKNIRQEDLELQVAELLSKIQIPREFCEWALEKIKEENTVESKDQEIIIGSLQKQYNSVVQKLDGLIDMRASGEIDETEFIAKKSEFSREKSRIQSLLDDSDSRVDNWLDRADKLFGFSRDAKFKFENGSLEERREIFQCLGSNFLLKDNKLTLSLIGPLVLMEEVSNQVRIVSERLEPLNNLSNTTKSDTFNDGFRPLLRR